MNQMKSLCSIQNCWIRLRCAEKLLPVFWKTDLSIELQKGAVNLAGPARGLRRSSRPRPTRTVSILQEGATPRPTLPTEQPRTRRQHRSNRDRPPRRRPFVLVRNGSPLSLRCLPAEDCSREDAINTLKAPKSGTCAGCTPNPHLLKTCETRVISPTSSLGPIAMAGHLRMRDVSDWGPGRFFYWNAHADGRRCEGSSACRVEGDP